MQYGKWEQVGGIFNPTQEFEGFIAHLFCSFVSFPQAAAEGDSTALTCLYKDSQKVLNPFCEKT